MFMRMMLLFIALPVFASDLQVRDARIQYQVTWDETAVHFKGQIGELQIIKKECNAHIVSSFNRNMQSLQSATRVTSAKADMTIVLNGKKERIHSSSRFGRGLHLLPQEIRRMKIEEKLVCK